MGESMFKVGDLVIDYCGDIGIVVKELNCDWWEVHYIDGTGEGSLWTTEMRLLCSK